jgi:hypothetical protein
MGGMAVRGEMSGWKQRPTCHLFWSSRIILFNAQAMVRMGRVNCGTAVMARIALSWFQREQLSKVLTESD